MHVLHFAETLIGGPATHLNQLLPYQVKAYDLVSVFCPQRHTNLIKCEGVNVVPFPDTNRSTSGLITLANHWRHHINKNNVDIVHLHSSFAGAVGRVFPPIQKVPVVYCARGWSFAIDTSRGRKSIYQLIERALSYRTDAIINISRNEATLAARAGIPVEKCRTVYNGISDAPWTPLPQGHKPQKLLFVGRYDHQKGIDLLFEAMSTLSQEGFTLETIGEAVIGKPSVSTFPSYIKDIGWQSAQDVQAAMSNTDIVVVPSRWEGFGFVAAEAMRAGRPVVASNVGGLSEIIVDGETGILCAPNSPNEIINSIRRVSSMDIRQLGINGRTRFEKLFTAERMFNEIDGIYTTLNRQRQN